VIRYTQLVRVALLLGLTLLAASAWAEKPAQETVLRGHVVPAKPVIQHSHETVKLLGEDGKTYELVVEADNYHTLHDPKLAGRLWEFLGYPQDGGRFEVRQLFTIVDGVRHKVQYYCDICHIVSFRPGQCMCCQEDVALQEQVYTPKE
jgi:hypothetical protein